MFFYVYVIKSIQYNRLYIGYTKNLVNRIKEHNQGINFSTKKYRPYNLLYYEACLNQKDALRREKYLKTSQGSRMLKRRLKEYYYTEKFTQSSTTR